MSIDKIKRKKFPWRSRIFVGNKRITKTFRTRRDAELFEAKMLTSPDAFIDLQLRERKTFAEYAMEWFEKQKPFIKLATQLKYSESIRIYLVPQLGHYNLREIRDVHIEDFKIWLAGQKIAPASRVFHFNLLRCIFKKARLQDRISKNPCLDIKNFKKPDPREEVWSEEELQKFMNFHRENPRLILYLLAANIGARIGEIWAIRKDEIRWSDGYYKIKHSFDQKTKTIGETKTKTSRTVFLPLEVCQTLLTLMKEDCDFVIPRDMPGLKDPSHASRVFKRDCVAAGVKPIRFHDLRHTWSTLFVEKTGNILHAMKVLGHTSLDMTKRYTHILERHLKAHRDTISIVPNVDEMINKPKLSLVSESSHL